YVDVGRVGIDHRRCRVEPHLDLGMATRIARKARYEPFRGEDRRHRDRQDRIGMSARKSDGLVELAESLAQPFEYGPAERRRNDAVCRPREDGAAKLLLAADDVLA